jgi:gluconokinase
MKSGNDNSRHGLSGPLPMAIVVMGVTGCGKSLVGTALAKALGVRYIEGDRLHPPANVERMRRGEALTDTLREGWLDAVGAAIRAVNDTGEDAVAACSALKRSYRDRLRRQQPGVIFIHLVISPEEARRRVAGRRGHFMPASLVDSQFATLEPPAADERALSVSGEMPVADIVTAAKRFLEGQSQTAQ